MDAKTKQLQIVSVFENDDEVLHYDYVNNEGDGRGYTCGFNGVTTADGDCLEMLQIYNKDLMNHFIPALQKLCDDNSDSTSELDHLGFKAAWATACKDPDFIKAQLQHNDETYYNPAVALGAKFGWTTPLQILCLYNVCVQCGETGTDSMQDIFLQSYYTPAATGKALIEFLSYYREVLLNPHDHSTKKEWSESVGRADCLIKLANEQNWNLAGTFSINPWGDEKDFVIGE
jgi:chitosanase